MDVALVRWPADEELRLELSEQGHPRLLLVEPGAAPPECTDVLEDWVRLPVSRADRRARIRTLESRAVDMPGSLPTVDEQGTLEYRGLSAHLSPTQALLVEPMIERFGAVVSRELLIEAGWPGSEASPNTLEVTMGRLRRQLVGVGLVVRTVRSRGYLLAGSERR